MRVQHRLRKLAPAFVVVGLIFAGGTLLEQSKWRSNLALFSHDVQAVPQSVMAQSNYCTMMLKIGDPAAAVAACETTVKLGRTTVDVLVRLGAAYEALGRLEDAKATIEKAVALDPHSAAAHAALGNIALNRGDLAGAERSLQQARAQDEAPNVLILQGRLAVAKGDKQTAFQAFDKLLVKAARAPRIRYMYADAAYALGDLPRARVHAEACLGLEPKAELCQALLAKLNSASP